MLAKLLLLLLSSLVIPKDIPSQHDTCSPFDCGNFSSIGFPFQLAHSNISNCGLPDFKLECEPAGGANIFLGNRSFYVKDFSMTEKWLLTIDTQLLDAINNGGCVLPSDFGLVTTLGYFNRSSHNTYVEFLKCSAKGRIGTCGTYDLRYRYKYSDTMLFARKLHANQEGYNFPSNDGACVIIKRYPVQKKSVLERDQLEEVLKDGFYLNWSLPVGCEACIENGGRCQFNDAQGDYICSCDGSLQQGECGATDPVEPYPENKRVDMSTWLITIGGSFLVVLLLAAIIALRRHKRVNARSENTTNVEDFIKVYRALMPKRYSCAEIKKMTNSWAHKLGQGGAGHVFKGRLPDGSFVAVKVLNKTNESKDTFINEVITLGRIHHINVVRLLGFCSGRHKRALVYEFMPNGSLDKLIYSREIKANDLGWQKIYEIASCIARGIQYLHQGCNMRILHFDIKPHNILLDSNYNPKISDFGLAKMCNNEKSSVTSMAARGTLGYIAPELFSRSFGTVSFKSDVYSYGMLILEMIGGRKNRDISVLNPSQTYFPIWVYDQISQGRELKVEELTQEEKEIIKKMGLVGLWCIQMNPVQRPSINMVIQMLEGSLESLQLPPKPFLSPQRDSLLLY